MTHFKLIAKVAAIDLFPNSADNQDEFFSLALMIEEKIINEYQDEERDKNLLRLIQRKLERQKELNFKKRVEKLFREMDKRKRQEYKLEQMLMLSLLYILFSKEEKKEFKNNIQSCRPRF